MSTWQIIGLISALGFAIALLLYAFSESKKECAVFIACVCLIIATISFIEFGSTPIEAEEVPYLKYVITTYSGGKAIDVFEVYSDMQGYYRKGSVIVYDSYLEDNLLFYSTLEYKIENPNSHKF